MGLKTISSLIIATLSLLVASLLMPTTGPSGIIYLTISPFTKNFTTQSNGWRMSFGLWGYCQEETSNLFGGQIIESSCSGPKPGYEFDSTAAHALKLDQFAGIISKSNSSAFILHPIACLFALFSLILAIMTYRERNSGIKSTKDQVTLLAVALTILTTFVVFIMDLVLILSVQAKASLATAGIAQVWAGAAFGLATFAFAVLMISFFFSLVDLDLTA